MITEQKCCFPDYEIVPFYLKTSSFLGYHLVDIGLTVDGFVCLFNSKMLGMMEELQKERQLDKDMVAGVQKAMTLIRETHVQDQTRWDEDKARMERQLVEVVNARALRGSVWL